MTNKTISVNDSPNDIIIKKSRKRKLSSFYGALNSDDIKNLERNIKATRRRHLSAHLKRSESLELLG